MKPNRSSSKVLLAVLVVVFMLFAATSLLRREAAKSRKKSPAKVVSTQHAGQQVPPVSTAPTSPGNGLSPAANTVAARSGTNTTHTIAPNRDGQLSASALKQIGALEAEKAMRTPVQQKIDSQLLYADRMRRGLPIAEGVPTLRVDLDKDDQGRILLDIKAKVTDALLQYIKTLGGNVINEFPQYHAIRAAVPLANIEKLAARSEVEFVEPAVRATTSNVDSEGDYTHKALTTRLAFRVNGSGVKVGVLSDSVNYLATSQIASLVTVLPGQSGTNYPNVHGEGTAMLEIVNDLAPGAQLYFATGEGGDASFALSILELELAGCNIIVDDLLYPDESPFQDGIVAKEVNSVTASGVLYFSSAGNSGNQDDGTSGTWEGDFVDGGQAPAALESGRICSFGNGMNYDTFLGPGPGGNDSSVHLNLFWSDPSGASSNDYDLFVLDATGSYVVASSTNPQNGTQDPYENCAVSSGDYIVIVKYSGAVRFLHLDTGVPDGGELSISTQGSTRGHDCATNAFAVAATDVANAEHFGTYYPFAGGSEDPVERFSSDGRRRVFYQADGTPITPGNFSSTGGAVRLKPDITAADGVTTDLPPGPLNPFYGTSAAAPHAAAIAALLKSYDTNLTPAQIRFVLTSTALDNMAPGWDRDSGAGIVMALPALQAVEPDLTQYSAYLSTFSPYAGETITASLVIANGFCGLAGNNVGPFHVGFYGLSTTPTFAGLSPFYEAPVGGCAAYGTVPLIQNITISTGTAPGTYYLGYKINDENEVAECNTANNGIFSWAVTVLPPPPPTVAINFGAGNVVLSWPTYLAGYKLENTTNLASGIWLTNSTVAFIVNGRYTITNAVSSGTRFYRLAF